VFQTIPIQNLVNFGHREGHCFEFRIWKMENFEKNQKSDRARLPAAQAYVSRPACTHVRTATPQWLGHRPPPRTGGVDRSPPLLHAQLMQSPPPRACRALMPHSGHTKIHSPPLPQQPPSSRPTLLCLPPSTALVCLGATPSQPRP
jgi:hypothetical protein